MDIVAADTPGVLLDISSSTLQDPAWLLNDIEDMKQSRHVLQSTEVIRPRKKHGERNAGLCLGQYKNLQKEKKHSAVASGLLPLSSREELRLPPLDLESLFECDVTNKAQTTEIIAKIKERAEKKKKNKERYMVKSLSRPVGLDLTPKTRPPSPSGLQICTSSFKLPVGQPLTRPNTAPNIREHNKVLSNQHCLKPSINRSLVRQGSSITQDGLQQSVAIKLVSFLTAVVYLSKLRTVHVTCKAQALRESASARKLSRWWTACMRKKEHQQSLLRSQVPEVFTRFFYRYRRRVACNRISTFLVEFSKVKSTTIVKKFMMCVRKAQRFVRSCLEIKRARQCVLYAYWRRNEVQIRKQVADAEKESRTRCKNYRSRRVIVPPGKGNYISMKWKETSNQVNNLLSHLDGVQYELKQIARSTSRGMPFLSNVDDELVDRSLVCEVIDQYVRYKRKVHLENVKNRHASTLSDASGVVDVITVRKILRNYKMFSTELLDKQLGQMAKEKNKNSFVSQKKLAAQYPFLCLTDTSLGTPWKKIIEEVVRTDISCKKSGRDTRTMLKSGILAHDDILFVK